VISTTMDGCWGFFFLLYFFLFKFYIPWLSWKGALAIGVGKLAAMAIMANTFNSDHPNYVLHIVYHDPLEILLYSMCKWDGGGPIYVFIFIIIIIIIHDIMYFYICNRK
jgi:hypothetical protein